MTTGNSVLFIDTTPGLCEWVSALRAGNWLAVDTEFIRERTYYPYFCLLQLATAHCVACIDVLAVADLSPLDPLFDDSRVVKIFHAGRQDLEILYRLRGRLPEPIFDTQVAAPFVGLAEQIGYSALASQLLRVTVDKSHTRTDWSLRPLRPAQLRYAADDVLYLGLIYQHLHAKLDQLGRLTWVDEEMARLRDTRLYTAHPEEAWIRIAGGTLLNERQAGALQALAAWRERLAQQQDCPRNWLIKDEILVELAKQGPATLAELRGIRGVDDRVAKRYGPTLLKLVANAPPLPPTSLPNAAPRDPRDAQPQEVVLDVLTALLRLRAAEMGLPPALLASRKELREFIEGPSGTALLQGWRKKVIGEDLYALLSGQKSLGVSDHGQLELRHDRT